MDNTTLGGTPPCCVVCGGMIPTPTVLQGPYGPYHPKCGEGPAWVGKAPEPVTPSPNVSPPYYDWPTVSPAGPWEVRW